MKDYLINKFPFILYLRKIKSNKIKINGYNSIMLHDIPDNRTLKLWIQNINLLKKYYKFVFVPSASNELSITIDDRFANIKPFLDYAVKFNVPVTLFISSLGIENKIYPYSIFKQLFRKLDKNYTFKYKNYKVKFITNNRMWREREVFKFNRFLLKKCSYKEYIDLSEKFLNIYSDLFSSIDEDLKLLNKEDIIYYSSYENISIQSHGIYHYDMRRLNNKELEIELEYSKKKIEEITKKSVDYFAYPYGFYNSNVIEFTKLFYKKAFIVNKDNNDFHINRIGIDGKKVVL